MHTDCDNLPYYPSVTDCQERIEAHLFHFSALLSRTKGLVAAAKEKLENEKIAVSIKKVSEHCIFLYGRRTRLIRKSSDMSDKLDR